MQEYTERAKKELFQDRSPFNPAAAPRPQTYHGETEDSKPTKESGGMGTPTPKIEGENRSKIIFDIAHHGVKGLEK